jgi:hypothetical protein
MTVEPDLTILRKKIFISRIILDCICNGSLGTLGNIKSIYETTSMQLSEVK